MPSTTNSTPEKQLEKFYFLIASDVMLAESALRFCYIKIQNQNYGKWDSLLGTIKNFATVAMAVHACRSFETHDDNLIQKKRKYPVYSFYHLAHFLESSTLAATVDIFIPFAKRLNDFDNQCATCDREMQFNDIICRRCLPIRLGGMIKKRCDDYANLIRTCRDFRDKWVAHAECPISGVSTTYADYQKLSFFAIELLNDVSCYMLNGLHHKDIVDGGMVNKFNTELQEMLRHLPRE